MCLTPTTNDKQVTSHSYKIRIIAKHMSGYRRISLLSSTNYCYYLQTNWNTLYMNVCTHVFGMFRILEFFKNMIISVPLPRTPTTNIMLNRTGMMYVSGRSSYGTYFRSQSGSSRLQSYRSSRLVGVERTLILLRIVDASPMLNLLISTFFCYLLLLSMLPRQIRLLSINTVGGKPFRWP